MLVTKHMSKQLSLHVLGKQSRADEDANVNAKEGE